MPYSVFSADATGGMPQAERRSNASGIKIAKNSITLQSLCPESEMSIYTSTPETISMFSAVGTGGMPQTECRTKASDNQNNKEKKKSIYTVESSNGHPKE